MAPYQYVSRTPARAGRKKTDPGDKSAPYRKSAGLHTHTLAQGLGKKKTKKEKNKTLEFTTVPDGTDRKLGPLRKRKRDP